MTKGQFPWVIVIIEAVAFVAWHVLGLVLASLGLFIAYFLSLRMHPRMKHWRCKGTGEHRGIIFTWSHRRCPGCSSGRVVRFGARYLGADHIQAEHRRTAAARELAKKNGKWR